MRTTISANIKTIADPIDPNLGTNKILVAIPTAAAKDEFLNIILSLFKGNSV